MGDRIVGIAIVGDAPNEGDRTRQAIAFAAPDDSASTGGGADIIDAKIERRLWTKRHYLLPHSQAGGIVHQREYRPRGHQPRFYVADQRVVPGQA